jgi:predicted nucleic acid-binding protein
LTSYLLDTNVISILAPSRTDVSPHFIDWLVRMDGEAKLFLSVVTVHEIEKGIARLDHSGALAKANALRSWLAGLLATYDDKILAFDAHAAALAGRLEAKAISAGYQSGMADAMIAGLATAHDLVIVTRNLKHFVPFGVAVMSPDDMKL